VVTTAVRERVASPVQRQALVRWVTTLAVLLVIVFFQGDRIAHLVGPGRPVLIQALVTGLLLGGVYGLVAMGLSLIFGVLHIINFAHGAMMTVGMYASFYLVAATGLDPYASIIVSVALLFAIGSLVQRFLINRIMGQPLENQLLLTLGIAIFIENALLLAFTATPRAIQLPYGRGTLSLGFFEITAPFRVFGAVASLPRTVAFVGALLLAGGLYLLLQKTKLGTAIRAVAQNPAGASLVGVNVPRIYVLTFGLGAACVGAAGVLVLPFLSLEPTTGDMFNILAFVIVVLGGMGSVVGALLGGLLIGVTQELGGVVFLGQSKLLAVFIVFVLVLYLRPQGLFGKALE
jgi:branched-chain amino acid transport system permease protein